VQAQLNCLIDTSLLNKKKEGIVDYLKELYMIQNASIACPKTTPDNQLIVVLDIFTESEQVKTVEEQIVTEDMVVVGRDDPLEQLTQSAHTPEPTIATGTDFKGTEKYYKTRREKKKNGQNALRQPLVEPKVPNSKCPKCNLSSATEYHISLHDPIPVDCPICQKTYPDKFRLESHKKKCIASKLEFACETCGKQIIGRRNFQNHMNGHLPNEKRKFGCDQCEKRFNLLSHLYVNIENQFLCKLFIFFLSHRQNHQLTHNLNRPHLCHLCASTFQQKCGLQRHLLKSHANMLSEKELPQLKCDCCDRLFFNDVALKVHLTRMRDRNYPKNAFRSNSHTKEVSIERFQGFSIPSKFCVFNSTVQLYLL
jgi:hypothetical protein